MLPQDAVVWSASLSGKPIRPGKATDGGLLLPLEKARSGEEAPSFAVEILYFKRGTKWTNNGKLKLDLPLLDLPISRTGLLYYYPPLFKVTPESGGSFRTQAYQDPFSAALNKRAETAPSTPAAQQAGAYAGAMDLLSYMSGSLGEIKQQTFKNDAAEQAKKQTQVLVDNYRTRPQEGKRAGVLPISLSFPTFGPSIFLVSELTAENQSPTVEISYEGNKKGGAK
jgi:hypothetical protein